MRVNSKILSPVLFDLRRVNNMDIRIKVLIYQSGKVEELAMDTGLFFFFSQAFLELLNVFFLQMAVFPYIHSHDIYVLSISFCIYVIIDPGLGQRTQR